MGLTGNINKKIAGLTHKLKVVILVVVVMVFAVVVGGGIS